MCACSHHFAHKRVNIAGENPCQTAKIDYIIFLTKTMNGKLLGCRVAKVNVFKQI